MLQLVAQKIHNCFEFADVELKCGQELLYSYAL